MKYRALAGLVLLALMGTVLTGCAGAGGRATNAMLKLQEGLEDGQSLEDVQASMSDDLKARATIYPAQKIAKQDSGNWVFTAKKDGAAGDTDAPFLVLLIAPETAGESSLAILFEDEAVMASEWYDVTSTSMLKKALLGNIYEQADAEAD
jgi:hypothetical protein